MQQVSPLVRMMAITALFIGAVCVPAANVRASSSSNSLAEGLVSYWPLDEADGSREDLQGSNDLIPNNGVSSSHGIRGLAAALDPSKKQSLSISDGLQNGLDFNAAFSFSGWYKFRSLPTAFECITPFSKFAWAGNQSYVLNICHNAGVQELRLTLTDDGAPLGSPFEEETQVASLAVEQWHHITIAYNGDRGQVEFYVDGEKVGLTHTTSMHRLFNSSEPFILGAHGTNQLHMSGLIDEVGLWNRALTPEEVALLYNEGRGLPYSYFGSTTDPEPEAGATSSVAFIPGIMGSRLYRPASDGGEERLWERVADDSLAALALTEDGTSVNASVYAKGVVDEIRPLTGLASLITAGEGYRAWMDYMDELVARGDVPAWKALAYDWRLATDELYRYGAERSSGGVNYAEVPATGMPYLLAQLEILAAQAPSGKVTIVAHSNGGLVAKNLLKYLDDTNSPLLNKIDTVILVASPQLGTPKAIRELLHGIEMPAQQTVRKTLQYMPGAYGLLPAPALMGKLPAAEPVVEGDESLSKLSVMNDLAGRSLHTYDELASFLTAESGTRTPASTTDYLYPNILSSTLLDRAHDMHAAADAWSAPEGVRFVEIVGTGLWTPRGVHYRAIKARVTRHTAVTSLKSEWRANMNGDGTVLAAAAESGEADRTYYVDLSGFNKHAKKAFAHGTILSAPPVQELVRTLLQTDEPATPLYMNTAGTHSAFPRAEMRAYSPVDMHLYEDGKHTGVLSSTTTDLGRPFEAEVPNSHYEEWTDVKYLGTMLEGGETNVTLDGTGWGTFTLECDLFDGDAKTGSYLFMDVPVGPQSTGRVVLTEDAAPTLAYDMNGDGKVDMTVTAQPSGTELTSAGLMARLRMYVRTAGLSRWLTEWIDGRLEVAEKLILKRSKGNMTAAKVILRTIEFTLTRQTPQHIPEEKAAVMEELLSELISRL